MLHTFLVLSLFSCQEKDDPNIMYGDYIMVSMVGSEAIDVTDNGVASEDLYAQLTGIGKHTNSYFLTLYSPEYWNVAYSQITYHLPRHLESTDNIYLELLYGGRKFETLGDGSILLNWNTNILYDDPHQLGDKFIANRISFESKNQIIHLDAVQEWYDYSQGIWKEITVRYHFRKR